MAEKLKVKIGGTVSMGDIPLDVEEYLDDIDDECFLNLIDYSVKQGKTEITALLMQKLHERRSCENNE